MKIIRVFQMFKNVKNIILCYFLIVSCIVSSQNLIPNSSFELKTECPPPPVFFPIPQFADASIDWYIPNNHTGTPDRFDVCATVVNPVSAAPTNYIGYQVPLTGDSYVGLITYSTTQANFREYIQVKTLAPLIAGIEYEFCLNWSLANGSRRASDQLGVYFSVIPPEGVGNWNPLSITPQFETPVGLILSDTTNWNLLCFTYIATGGEEWITIGNFNNDLNTNVSVIQSGVGPAYYYIDDVSLICSSPSLSSQNHTICNGDSFILPSGLAVTAPGVYIDTLLGIAFGGCDSVITTNLTVYSPSIISISSSNEINCTNLTSIINAESLGNILEWNGVGLLNSPNPATVSSSGTYYITATNPLNGCTAIDSVVVSENMIIPIIESINHTGEITCSNPTSVLNADSPGNIIEWSGGILINSPNPTSVTEAGLYTVMVTNPLNGCSNSESLILDENLNTSNINAGPNQVICDGEFAIVMADNPDMAVINWSNGVLDNLPFILPVGIHTLVVTATDIHSGCQSNDSLIIEVLNLDIASISYSSDQFCINQANVLPIIDGELGGVFSINNGGIINATTGEIDFNNLNTGNYLVSYTTIGLCPSINGFMIEIISGGEVHIQDISSICIGSEVYLSASPLGGVWSGSGVLDINLGLFNSDITGIGSHFVFYDVIGVCGNIRDSILIEIISNPAVNFTADTLMGCEPLEVTFVNLTNVSGNNCLWNFGNGITANGCGNVTNIYQSEGNYDVSLTVTDNNGCVGTTTYSQYIEVNSTPKASFYASSYDLTVEDTHVDFTNTSINATNYLWTFGYNSPSSTNHNPIHIFPNQESGNYEVNLIAYNGACSDTAKRTIIISDIVLFFVPNVFTPDQNNNNEIFQPIFTSGYDPFNFQLIIFNRWGEIIFESHDASKGWNGTYGGYGEICLDDVYIWKISFKETDSDKRHEYFGHVSLIK